MPSLDGMDALLASDASGRPEQQPVAAEAAAVGEAPALGALNRQLRLLAEQLGAAHRLIGQIAAERDGLRQQIADLQGVPFDAIVVPSVGASTNADAPTDDALRDARG